MNIIQCYKALKHALLTTATLSIALLISPFAAAGDTQKTYVVLYKSSEVPKDAKAVIQSAGGTIAASYDPIGVVIATSSNDSFRQNLSTDNRIESVGSTEGLGTPTGGEENTDNLTDNSTTTSSTLADSACPTNFVMVDPPSCLSTNQWDMRQMFVPEAHAITLGKPTVTIGNLDTGVDSNHPDLAANIDIEKSVSCLTGAPIHETPPSFILPPTTSAILSNRGHGTSTAGIMVAAKDGYGLSGIAPNVKLASIRVSNSSGYIFPEAAICGYMWAGSHKMDVANNSYYIDPWLFNCRNNAEQRAIWKAVQRAIKYAMSNGVVMVVSSGNNNHDLAHPTIDTTSPDFPAGAAITREVTNACVRLPSEIPGVIVVGGVGSKKEKAYFSSYGVGYINVVAPTSDEIYQFTPQAPTGLMISTQTAVGRNLAPLSFCSLTQVNLVNCKDQQRPTAVYVPFGGTSGAAPHVTGVVALMISQYGKLKPGQLQALINQNSDAIPCPANPFLAGTAWEAMCQGGNGYNSFYGHGQINALKAVGGSN